MGYAGSTPNWHVDQNSLLFLLAHFQLRYIKKYEIRDLVHFGLLWLGLTLVFEWAGSIAIARPVQEILVSWNIAQGYMWYFVLMTYLTSNLLLGIVFYPGKEIE